MLHEPDPPAQHLRRVEALASAWRLIFSEMSLAAWLPSAGWRLNRMKKTFLALATAVVLLLGTTGVRAQSAPPRKPCPRCGTLQQGQGPKDGTGYGAKSGKKAGRRAGPRDGSGLKNGSQGRRGGR